MWQKLQLICLDRFQKLLTDYHSHLVSKGHDVETLSVLQDRIISLHSEYGKQKFFSAVRFGLVDLIFATIGAWSLTILTYIVTVNTGNVAILPLLISIDLLVGIGGLSSIYRTLYFVITLGLPTLFSSKFSFNQKIMRLGGCFLTCFEGGWTISPILRSVLREDKVIHRAFGWQVRRSVLSIPRRLVMSAITKAKDYIML